MHRDTTAPLAPGRLLVRRVRARPGARREGPRVRRRARRRARRRRAAGPAGTRPAWAPAWDCRSTTTGGTHDAGRGTRDATSRPSCGGAASRKMSEVYGWELPGRPRRLLPLHRRPPLRRHLEPARAQHTATAGCCSSACWPGTGQARRPEHPGAGRVRATASWTTRRCARSSSSSRHYAGWPMGARLYTLVEETIGKGRRGGGRSGQRAGSTSAVPRRARTPPACRSGDRHLDLARVRRRRRRPGERRPVAARRRAAAARRRPAGEHARRWRSRSRAGALAGYVTAGINRTRRGAASRADVATARLPGAAHRRRHLPLLDGLELPGVRVVDTDGAEWAGAGRPRGRRGPRPADGRRPWTRSC